MHKKVKADRGVLNNQISYRNMNAEMQRLGSRVRCEILWINLVHSLESTFPHEFRTTYIVIPKNV